MTEREFNLLIFYMKSRIKVLLGLGIALLVLMALLTYALRSEGTNETLSTLLGIGIGGVVAVVSAVGAAVSRDVTEYLKDSRQMPERGDT